MTSEARFTLDDVLDATRKIVEEKGGDYIYDAREGCTYAVGGNPSCLVGHVINALDPATFRDLAVREEKDGTQEAKYLMGDLLPSAFWTEDAADAMQTAQNVQDSGKTWGAAVYAAENLGADAE